MAYVPPHNHTFVIPTATPSEVLAGTRDDVAITPLGLLESGFSGGGGGTKNVVLPYEFPVLVGASSVDLSAAIGKDTYVAGLVRRVLLNGVELSQTTDWSATNGKTVDLVRTIDAGDIPFGETSASVKVYYGGSEEVLTLLDSRYYPAANAYKNLKDYGGKLQSGVDDTAAIALARASTSRWASIRVPAGPWNNNSTPPADKTVDGVKLWQLEGNCFGNSSVPVVGISGADTVETFVLGSKYFGRPSSYADAGPVFRIDGKFDHTGGAEGNVINSFLVNTTIETVSPNFVWGGLFVTSSKGRGGGQHAGLVSAMKRPPDALADGFGPRDQIFGNYTEVMDLPEVLDADTAGSTVGYELDLFCHGTDLLRRRQVLSINIGKPYNMGSDGEVGRGIHLNTNNPGSYYGTMFSATANFRVAGIDFRGAGALNGAARHIMMPPSGKIGWVDTTNPSDPFVNTFDIEYVAGLAGFNFFGAKKMQISDDATNAVKVWVGGQLRSLNVKAQSSLVGTDLVFVAGA